MARTTLSNLSILFEFFLDLCDKITCHGGNTCESKTGKCLCGGIECGDEANHCEEGTCKCGDLAKVCDKDGDLPKCNDQTTHKVDPHAFQDGFMTTRMRCEEVSFLEHYTICIKDIVF